MDTPEPLYIDDESFIIDLDPRKKDLGRQIFKDVWTEFYTWEQMECRRVLDSLAVSVNLRTDSPTLKSHILPNSSLVDSAHTENDREADRFSIWEYDTDGSATGCSEITSCEVVVGDWSSRKASPRYEFCTPISRSVRKNEIDNTSAPFAPYADDPLFLFEEYLSGFDNFSWQVDFFDPDKEMIELETARRLYRGYGFTLVEIDALTNIEDSTPMLRRSRISPKSGLIWDTSQRDLLWWSGSAHFDYEPIPTRFVPKTYDIFADVNRGLTDFCPNLNCLYSYCPIHDERNDHNELDFTYRRPYPSKPNVTSASMGVSVGKACGDDCFRHIEDDIEDALMEEVFWENPDDIAVLSGVFKIAADLEPCDLAVLCRKPCREIFVYRRRLFSDDKIEADRLIDEPPSRFLRREFVDEHAQGGGTPPFRPLNPCRHKGLCYNNPNCTCFNNSQHCQRNCRCDVKCEIRWKGCKCHRSSIGLKKTLCKSADSCSCRATGRECDPELCLRCDAREKKNKRICQNNDIQQARFQPILVCRSDYGSGAFATCDIPKGTLLAEYTGEILYREYVATTDNAAIHEYTKLNYMFDLNSDIILDAVAAGNETRYLNHSSENPNCDAHVVLVNGEHRIALITRKKVKSGNELFLDYGGKYWMHHEKES